TAIDPWPQETFAACLNMHCTGWVIVNAEQQITGFILSLIHTKECHILNFAILPAYQHQGLGCQLLMHALREAKEEGAENAYLEVRASNTVAIALYQKARFFSVGIRKAYYPLIAGKREDAILLACNLNSEQ
ncbi:MAG: ribosomal-protein-alanine acetyltransferase, partial [uncultured bacterium]